MELQDRGKQAFRPNLQHGCLRESIANNSINIVFDKKSKHREHAIFHAIYQCR